MKNEGDIKVSIKQARRVFVLEQLSEGKMTNAEGAKALGLSIRQIQRILYICETTTKLLYHFNTKGVFFYLFFKIQLHTEDNIKIKECCK